MPSAGSERPGLVFGRRERNAEARVCSVALSPDGRYVAGAADDGALVVWTTESPAHVWRTSLRGGGATTRVWFAEDGDLVLKVGGRLERRKVFEERGRTLTMLTQDDGTLFSTTGHTGIAVAGRSIHRFDVASAARNPVDVEWDALVRGHSRATGATPIACGISRSGTRAVVLYHLSSEQEPLLANGRRLVVVDFVAGKTGPAIPLPEPHSPARFHPLDEGGVVVLPTEGPPWLLEAGRPPRRFDDAGKRSSVITAGIETPEGGFLGAGLGGGVVWDVASGAVRTENRELLTSAPSLSLVRGRVAAPQHSSVGLFAFPSLARIGGGAAHRGDVRFVEVSSRGRQVFSSDTHSVRSWQAQSAETMWEADGQLLAVSPDATRVVAFHRDERLQGHVAVIDAATGDRIDSADAEVAAACIREDRTLLTAVRTSNEPAAPVTFAFCEDVDLREAGRTQEAVETGFSGAVFAPRGASLLVSRSGGSQTLCFDVPSGTVRWTANGGYPVISADGAYVALTSGGTHGIHLFEMATGEERGHVTLESWRVVAWGPGDLLLAVSPGKDPRVLRLDRRELASFANLDPPWLELEGGSAMSTGGSFFPDGTRVVMGDERGMLRLWRVDTF